MGATTSHEAAVARALPATAPAADEQLSQLSARVARETQQRERVLARVREDLQGRPTAADALNAFAALAEEPRLISFCALAAQAKEHVSKFFESRQALLRRYPGECEQMDELYRRYVDLLHETMLAIAVMKTAADNLQDAVAAGLHVTAGCGSRLQLTAEEEAEVRLSLKAVGRWLEKSHAERLLAKWSAFIRDCEAMNSVWKKLKRAAGTGWHWLKWVAVGLGAVIAASAVAAVIVGAAAFGTPAAGVGVAIGFWEAAGAVIAANAALFAGLSGAALVSFAAGCYCGAQQQHAQKVTQQAQQMVDMLQVMMQKGELLKGALGKLHIAEATVGEKAKLEVGSVFRCKRAFEKLHEYLDEYKQQADQVLTQCEGALSELRELLAAERARS